MSDALDVGRRRARRWAAMVGFGFLILYGVIVTGVLLFHPARDEIATALSTANAALVWAITPITAVVLTYLGVSLKERLAAMQRGS